MAKLAKMFLGWEIGKTNRRRVGRTWRDLVFAAGLRSDISGISIFSCWPRIMHLIETSCSEIWNFLLKIKQFRLTSLKTLHVECCIILAGLKKPLNWKRVWQVPGEMNLMHFFIPPLSNIDSHRQHLTSAFVPQDCALRAMQNSRAHRSKTAISGHECRAKALFNVCMREEKITVAGGMSTWSVNAHRSSQSSPKPPDHFQDNFLISFFVVIQSKKSPLLLLLTSVDYRGLSFKPFHTICRHNFYFIYHMCPFSHTRKNWISIPQRKTRLAREKKKKGNFLTSLVFLSSMHHKALGNMMAV